MKMKNRLALILFMVVATLIPVTAWAQPKSTKDERNYIAEGNKLLKDGKYAEAEVLYRKALQANPASEVAVYNIGSALLRQARQAEGDDMQKMLADANSLMARTAENASDATLRGWANYNMGNINYNDGKYQQAIEYYKNALRINPNDDNARQNLRLAQKKLKEQQQNQDKNKDNNQDQNKDKDKDKEDKDDKKDQNDQNKDNKDDKDDNQNQQPPQGGISDQNADNILKAMEKAEAATRQRVNERAKQGNPHRVTHGNPW